MSKDRPIFFIISPCMNGGDHESLIFSSITPPPLDSLPQQGYLFSGPCPKCHHIFIAELHVTTGQQGWNAIGPVITMAKQ